MMSILRWILAGVIVAGTYLLFTLGFAGTAMLFIP